LQQTGPDTFVFPAEGSSIGKVSLSWREVRQVLKSVSTHYVADLRQVAVWSDSSASLVTPPVKQRLNQIAVSPERELHVAADSGLWVLRAGAWERVQVPDDRGREWAVRDALGVAFDKAGRLWVASRAGVACRNGAEWKFYEGKDGLPWNDFTGIAPGVEDEIWFATRLGAIRLDKEGWHYRQGKTWLPNDEVNQIAVDAKGRAWFSTAGGIGAIERQPMTLASKAEIYEKEIERYVKRTPFGFVAEAPLREAGVKSTANPQDSDNDGLWTAMYGAGECFSYEATKDRKAKERARKAFEALRFLQKVTQGGSNSPPKGYVARTIRPITWPDPNAGRLESDREQQKGDKLWKVYEPRWPKSADGQWYWKSDTSSDELDGHYFFYPLYFDFCAETEEERERVRDVVRWLTDHLLEHDFSLIDHDGKPTRWAVYGPGDLNTNRSWWLERGLKSLSILSYLAVASHVTGDPKYEAAARKLIDQHGYAHNAMHPKVQHGPGSGNQSDDEMAFMCFYTLLRYSKDEQLKSLMRISFFRYWVNEAPELNPFFAFAYAGLNLNAKGESAWGQFSLAPASDWLSDAAGTLYGFPLDRLNWGHRNSHRLDIVPLPRVASSDYEQADGSGRGLLVNGKVLPVENRHFNHWNTDPWHLDYGGDGNELAAGTVFLLPYYMGLYHGFIER
jgi:hypothetical protein